MDLLREAEKCSETPLSCDFTVSVSQTFTAPSFDDKILEVVAVFGSMQMAVSRVINLQHHRIAQVLVSLCVPLFVCYPKYLSTCPTWSSHLSAFALVLIYSLFCPLGLSPCLHVPPSSCPLSLTVSSFLSVEQ